MAGYDDEAEAWREWLLRAVAGDPRDLRIMYGARAASAGSPELELDWLPGYEESLPGAGRQRRVAASSSSTSTARCSTCCTSPRARDCPHEAAAWEMELRDHGRARVERGASPTRGSGRCAAAAQHFTHSKVMAWVGVDRAIRAVELFGFDGPVDRWRALRDEIHDEICREGFDDELGYLHPVLRVEGARRRRLLMMPLRRVPAADDPTRGRHRRGDPGPSDGRRVRAALRHRDARRRTPPGGEGAFIPCTCWLADCLALQGRDDEARELFERVLDVRNDVGLLSEEYDRSRRRLVGNFPQAFSHVSVIGTARNLSRGEVGPADRRRRPLAAGLRARSGRGRR